MLYSIQLLQTYVFVKQGAYCVVPLPSVTDDVDAAGSDLLSAAKLTPGPGLLLGRLAVPGAATSGVLSPAVVPASVVAPASRPASLLGLGLGAPAEGTALLGALVMLDPGATPSLRVIVRANGRRSRVSRR